MRALVTATLFLAAVALLPAARVDAARQVPSPVVPPMSGQTAGTFTSGSIPPDGGFGIVVFGGGSFQQLTSAAACPDGTAVIYWVTNTTGTFITFVPSSTVGAVNAGFSAQYPAQVIPASTPLIGRCAPTSAQLQVTLADDGGTVALHVGDTFLLNLGGSYNWNAQVADTTVVSRVVNITVISGAQGVYRANQAGTTTLTATGTLSCPPGTACPAIARAFTVTLVVQ